MPRLRGKYDHPKYAVYPRDFKIHMNFNEPLEALANKDRHFAQRWNQLSEEFKLRDEGPREVREKVAREIRHKIWGEVLAAMKRLK